MAQLSWKETAERPGLEMWLFDRSGALLNMSSGTFTFKVGNPGETALLTKTTNIAGAAGAGVEPTGTPNVVVTWATGDLAIAPGSYTWELTWNTSSADRVFYGTINILDSIA